MKNIAKNNKEFDRRFDDGEDIYDLIDMSKAKVGRPGKKIRISLDIGEELLQEIDRIRAIIGVDRSALIKIWLHERVQREKAQSAKQ
ncbi:MAG: CopG family transcriptional regulator [Deltaproteobacteria bacterium]|nr:CopG family transcriptional regulator [Deltaproteobacteria bacterium]MBW2098806.1 CopG family transcriptional regulator [Deltaproteobacteria bacterium]